MIIISELFNTVLVNPFINILVAIYKGLSLIGVPYSLGFSIIVLTVVIRFIIYPFTRSQLLTSKKMQDLAPHISNLKTAHKNDSKRLQAETMKLYKEHGINPASGCLLLLIQMPIIYGLYAVLNKVVHLPAAKVVSEINSILYFKAIHLTHTWNPSFFGLPLGDSPSQLISGIGPLILLVPIITGVLQFAQSKMMLPALSKAPTDKKNDDFASAFQSQSTYLFPIMIGFFSFKFPIGLSLYWNTFSLFGIIQQYQVSGLGGLKIPSILQKKNDKKK